MNAMNRQNSWPNGRRNGLRLALAGMLGALAVPACANHVSVPAEIATCPCAGGTFCCSSGVCAKDATSCDVATAALSASVAGEWQGYFENPENYLISQDDALTISIAAATDGTLSGHVTIGQAAAPAPATDPDAPWPPGDPSLTEAPFVLSPFVSGFAYQARNIRWEAQRLRFEMAPDEAWQPWCALQSTYLSSGYFVAAGSYNCIPDPAPATAPASTQQGGQCFGNVDIGATPCFKAYLFCTDGGPCTCDVTGCQAKTSTTYSFDIALRDGIGDGSTSLTTSPIRLNQSSQN